MLRFDRIEPLIDYHQMATAKLSAKAESLSDQELDAPIVGGELSIRKTLKHIAEVDWTWRTVLETGGVPDWSNLPTDSISEIAGINAVHRAETEALKRWLRSRSDSDLDELITVHFPWSPEPETFTPWRILIQILMHGQQHRSEIAVELSRLGKSPGNMDFNSLT